MDAGTGVLVAGAAAGTAAASSSSCSLAMAGGLSVGTLAMTAVSVLLVSSSVLASNSFSSATCCRVCRFVAMANSSSQTVFTTHRRSRKNNKEMIKLSSRISCIS